MKHGAGPRLRFQGYDGDKSEIEIGWTFLARSHWGGIYNREMKMLMLRHAFRFVNRVIFLVGPQNVRSQRVMEKIGGVRVGREPTAVAERALSIRSPLPDCFRLGTAEVTGCFDELLQRP